jgi:hypothetical protein
MDSVCTQLAKVVQALVDLQTNEVRSSNGLATVLEKHLPGIHSEYLSARHEEAEHKDDDLESQSIRSLTQQIASIVRQLAQRQDLTEVLVAAFENLKDLDARVSSLQLNQEILRDTLNEMDPDVFQGTLERVRERREKNSELIKATAPFVRNASEEYDRIIRLLKAR